MSEKRWTESDRRQALAAYSGQDKSYKEDFDALATLASEICETPIAMINLVFPDLQVPEAHIGIEGDSTPADESFCIHAVNADDMMIVPDAQNDPRFKANDFVTKDPNIRFYAGAVLRDPDGVPIGAMCVIDREPRTLSEYQIKALKILSRQAMHLFDLRRIVNERDQSERLNKMIMESAVDYAIIATNIKGIIQSWNVGAENIMGWTEDEAVGQDIDMFFTREDDANDRSEKEMATALREGSARDERWHLRKTGEKYWADGRMMPLLDESGEPQGFIKIVRDRTEAHNRTVQRKHLSEEIIHRLKNSMTIVQSLAQQTIRRADTLEEASAAVAERLASYANAQNMLLRNDWGDAGIHVVVSQALAPHRDYRSRMSIEGPDVLLTDRRLIGLSLALHELVTNAMKYGALSVPGGSIKIGWTYDESGDDFKFTWEEQGGPAALRPTRKGFGSQILTTITSSYFSGKSTLEYSEAGFKYSLKGSLRGNEA